MRLVKVRLAEVRRAELCAWHQADRSFDAWCVDLPVAGARLRSSALQL
jgi:hypothetical protein